MDVCERVCPGWGNNQKQDFPIKKRSAHFTRQSSGKRPRANSLLRTHEPRSRRHGKPRDTPAGREAPESKLLQHGVGRNNNWM